MLRIMFFILQVGVLAAAAVWLSDNPGKIKISWIGYQIETHFSILLIVIVLIWLSVYVICRLINSIMRSPANFTNRRNTRRETDGYKALTLGMAAAAAGDKDEASRLSRKANKLLQKPNITHLLSAQTAALNGDEAAAVKYFNTLSESSETEFVGLIGLMRQSMVNNDQVRLLELTEKAYKKRPESVFVLETLFDLQTKMADWENSQITLFDSVRRKVKTESVAVKPRVTILTARAIDFKNNNMIEDAVKFSDQALLADKQFIPAAIIRTSLIKYPEKERRIINSLETLLSTHPHPILISKYLNLWPNESSVEQFKRLKGVLINSANSKQSCLILAEIALKAELWAEARKNLDKLLPDKLTAHGCLLMAQLEQRECNDELESRRWLEKSVTAPVDPSWTCDSCGATGDEWSALCGNCNAFDHLVWKTPPKVSALVPRLAFGQEIEEAKIIEQ